MTTPTQQPVDMEGRRALLFGMAALASALLIPGFGAALSAFALYVGIRARRGLKREGRPTTTAVWAITLAVTGLAIGLTQAVIALIFWSEIQAYQQCMDGAGTEQAKEDCQTQFMKSLEKRGVPTGGFPFPLPS